MKRSVGLITVATIATTLNSFGPANALGNQIYGYQVRAEVEASDRSNANNPFNIRDNPYLLADLAIGLPT